MIPDTAKLVLQKKNFTENLPGTFSLAQLLLHHQRKYEKQPKRWVNLESPANQKSLNVYRTVPVILSEQQ